MLESVRKSPAQGAGVAERARPVIDVSGLSLTFGTRDGPVYALSDVNLVVEKGEFVSFIGPSGCGKTTLLRVVADLETGTAGRVLVNGVSPEQARLERQYGYVFQAPALYPWRTVERNVMLPLEIMGFPAQERRERARRNLALVNLGGFERKYPWQLSGGMQQRVSIARALSFDPHLLFMDEPFGALDEIVRDKLNEQLLQLWRQTRRPFFSSPTPFRKRCSCRRASSSCRRARVGSSTSSIATCRPSARSTSARRRNS